VILEFGVICEVIGSCILDMSSKKPACAPPLPNVKARIVNLKNRKSEAIAESPRSLCNDGLYHFLALK
jgi:hypothetical protein